MIDPELAQRLSDLQAEVSGLRALCGLGALGWAICAALALSLWSRVRSLHGTLGGMSRTLRALEERSASQAADIEAAGVWAREEMARRRLRLEARRVRRCGTGS